MDDFNPYAAPEANVASGRHPSEADEGRGVWRDGKTLVMVKVAQLPSRCVKCNAPTTYRLKRSLSWHNPLLYILIVMPGLLIYVIVALIVRKTAKITVPLCDEHRARRSRNILIAWVCALTGVALWFATAFVQSDLAAGVFLAGVGIFLFGLIFGSLASQVVAPKEIDEAHIWLKKVGPLYLAELPPLPSSRGAETVKNEAYLPEL